MKQNQELKICKNCKHFLSYGGYGTDRCTRNPRIDIVTGEKDYSFCSIERGFELRGTCGNAGKYFEAKVLTEPEKRVSLLAKLKFWK